MPYIILIVLMIILVILLLVLLIRMLKANSKRKKTLKYFQEEYLRILKVDALDRAIVNPSNPMAIKTGPHKILVRVHEFSKLADKIYLLDMDVPWTIGRKPGEHTICIRGDSTVSSLHCRLIAQNGGVYLVDLGSKNRVYYKPSRSKKNKAWYLPQKGAQLLKSEDIFYVGYTGFEVTVFDSNYGIV